MAEEINRHSGWDGVSESVGRFLADPAWEREFRNLPEDWSNERKILHLLKTKMKEAGIATYLPEVAILRPRDDRVKMRLLLGTHHIQGVEVFRTVQKNVEAEAVSIRQNIEVERSGQPFLLPSNQLAEIEAKRQGVSCPAYLEHATEMMWRIVDGTPGIEFGSLTGSVMESVPVRTTDLNKIAVALRRTGQLRFDLPPRKRTPLSTTRIFSA